MMRFLPPFALSLSKGLFDTAALGFDKLSPNGVSA